MNVWVRWGRFNLVGGLGIGLQLGCLTLINRWAPGHCLCASALAIELTLLHNFIWHTQYTWRERESKGLRLRQFVRFHLANGMVSMLGNLALMRLLVRDAHLPVVAANAIAIACCSVLNYWLGNCWAFAAPHAVALHPTHSPPARGTEPA